MARESVDEMELVTTSRLVRVKTGLSQARGKGEGTVSDRCVA